MRRSYSKKEIPPKELKETDVPKRIPSKMYHGTIESRANKIWKYGLTPVAIRNYAWSQKGVYLTTNLNTAKGFAGAGNLPSEDKHGIPTGRISPFNQFRMGNDIVIVTVSTKGLDPKKFKQDPIVSDSLIYFGTIPAKILLIGIKWNQSM